MKKAVQLEPLCLYCLKHQFMFDKGSYSGQLTGWFHSTTRCYSLQDAAPDLKVQWIQRHKTVTQLAVELSKLPQGLRGA